MTRGFAFVLVGPYEQPVNGLAVSTLHPDRRISRQIFDRLMLKQVQALLSQLNLEFPRK